MATSRRTLCVLVLLTGSALMASAAPRKDNDRSTDSQSQNYRGFQYEVETQDDRDSALQFRQEDKLVKSGPQGSYGHRKPTGEFRVVDYLADEYGFNGRNKNSDQQQQTTTSSADVQVKNGDGFESPSTVSSRLELRSSNSAKSRQERNDRLEQLSEGPELLEQKPEKLIREQEVITTPQPLPKVMMTGQREVDSGRGADQAVFVKPVKQPQPQPPQVQQPSRKSIANKISIHQLVSEAMPTLQMSVVPVYFVNKVTKNVMAIPYLVMKSISKMPLLPGMFDGLNGFSQNLINFQHTPHRVQRSNFRSGSSLLPLLGSGERLGSTVRSQQQKEVENDLESELESERDSADWMPMNGAADSQFTEQSSNNWWRK